jgi:glutathione S-transferase
MYRLHGALASPYSMKMRAVLRARRLPHVWVHGRQTHAAATSKVKAPVIPVLEYPDGQFANDSTPLIYDLEARHPERSIVPDDPGLAFLAQLIEDFADEWLTKAMFGYRWLEEVDQRQMSQWLAFDAFKGGGAQAVQFAAMFRERQVGRMALVGCTAENFALIEASTRRVLDALEQHVVNEHWLFGTRPSLAEFGLYGQLSQLGVDPTPQALLRAEYPHVYRWLLHVDDASGIDGEWQPAEAPLAPVVTSLLAEIGRVYGPFLLANAAAAAAGDRLFRMTVDGLPYEQGVFKYQVKCLADLRARHAALPDAAQARIDPLLDAAGCLAFLA